MHDTNDFWNFFESLIMSTHNCHPGCGCINDRFEITQERVSSWIKDQPESAQKLLSYLAHYELTDWKELDNDKLEQLSNMEFPNWETKKNWFRLWSFLLKNNTDKDSKSLEQRIHWLEEDIKNLKLPSQIKIETDLLDIHLELNGQLDYLTTDNEWKTLAQTPLNSKIPPGHFYRFIPEAGVTDAELENLLSVDLPNLIDLRLYECHSLTDESLLIISEINTLQILSLGSLQISGVHLLSLSKLSNLTRLDLEACQNIPSKSIDELKYHCPNLSILRTR